MCAHECTQLQQAWESVKCLNSSEWADRKSEREKMIYCFVQSREFTAREISTTLHWSEIKHEKEKRKKKTKWNKQLKAHKKRTPSIFPMHTCNWSENNLLNVKRQWKSYMFNASNYNIHTVWMYDVSPIRTHAHSAYLFVRKSGGKHAKDYYFTLYIYTLYMNVFLRT